MSLPGSMKGDVRVALEAASTWSSMDNQCRDPMRISILFKIHLMVFGNCNMALAKWSG